MLAPPEVPLHRTRSQRFDDLVLEAVARLEPRWESQLAEVEFAVEEIPPPPEEADAGGAPAAVPLGRLDPGSSTPPRAAPPATDRGEAGGEGGPRYGAPSRTTPPRIVVYRRPLMARADGEEDLGELVFDVVVEEFARLLGLDPEDVDPDYTEGD